MKKRSKLILLIFVLFLLFNSCNKNQPIDYSKKTADTFYANDLYELFAPNKQELEKAKGKLDTAYLRFRALYSDSIPKITFLIFNTSEEISKFDFSEYKKNNKFYLPWLTASGLEENKMKLGKMSIFANKWGHSLSSLGFRGYDDLGFVLGNDKKYHCISVADTNFPLRVNNMIFKLGDLIKDLNCKVIPDVEGYNNYISSLPKNSENTFLITRNGKNLRIKIKNCYDWDKNTKYGVPELTSAKQQNVKMTKKEIADFNNNVLHLVKLYETGIIDFDDRNFTHEAGHIVTIAITESLLKQKRTFVGFENIFAGSKIYGHPLLPDWFDEALSVICEQGKLSDNHKAVLAFSPKQFINLQKFLLMPHLTTIELGEKAYKRLFNKVDVNLFNPFYTQSIAFLTYLTEKFGKTVVISLLKGFVAEKSFETIISESFNYSGSIADLEKEFIEWLKTKKEIAQN